MTGKNRCTETREMLAAFHDGWLDAFRRERVAAHLADCSSCREEAQRDRRLTAILAALPAFPAPELSWQPLSAPRQRWTWRPVLAMASTAALFILIGFWAVRAPAPRGAPAAFGASRSESAGWMDAHVFATVSWPQQDPNRAVLLLYSRREGERR